MTVDTLHNKNRRAEILLIEDNRGDAVLAERAFREASIPARVQVAESAEQALSMLRKEASFAACTTPDLIVLDLNLPRMHGHEFLHIVKEDPAFKHIPVVILSSSRAQRDVVQSYSHYANGYVVKPLNLEQLKSAIETVERYFFTLVTLPDATDIEPNGEPA